MGGCRPEKYNSDPRNTRFEERRRLLGEARAQKGL